MRKLKLSRPTFMSGELNGHNHNIKKDIKSFEVMVNYRYFVTLLTKKPAQKRIRVH